MDRLFPRDNRDKEPMAVPNPLKDITILQFNFLKLFKNSTPTRLNLLRVLDNKTDSIYPIWENTFGKCELRMKRLCVFLLFCILAGTVYGQTVSFRPNASIGYFYAGDSSGLSYDYGIKILLAANDFQRYGVKIDCLNLTGNIAKSYLGTGIFLEQVVFKYFNMGIGTVGYINLKHAGENPFGIYTHLGFEYSFTSHFNIMAAYQSEFIFSDPFTMNNAFTAGIGFKL